MSVGYRFWDAAFKPVRIKPGQRNYGGLLIRQLASKIETLRLLATFRCDAGNGLSTEFKNDF